MYYYSLIYKLCLHKQACIFTATAMSQTALLLLRFLFPIKLSINICWITQWVGLLQMATYWFVIGGLGIWKAQKSEVRQVANDVVKSEV